MADTEALLAKLRANRAQERETKDAAIAQSLAKVKAARRQENLISSNGKWHVLDGDTIEDRNSGERFRLRGLNTRETNGFNKVGQIGGEEQKQQLYNFIEERGGEIEVSRHGKDEYGRTVAELYAGGDSLNDLMVEAGAPTYWDETGARKGAVTRRLLNYKFDPNHFDAGRLDSYNRPAPRDHYYRTGDFKKAVMRGTDQSQAMLYAAADAVGSAIGSDALRDWAQEGIRANQQEAAVNPPRVGSMDNIEDIDDFATYFVEAIGEQVPQLGIDLGAAATGAGLAAVLGRRAAVRGALGAVAAKGAKIGGTTGIYSQTMGETQLGLLEEGIDSPATAFGIGGLKAGLEYIGISSMLKGLSRSTGIAEGTISQMANVVAQRSIGSSITEASTEAAQTVLDFMAIGLHKPDFDMFSEENLKELREAAAKGAIVGGTFRGVGETAQATWSGLSNWADSGATQVEATGDIAAQANEVAEGRRTAVHLAANSPDEQHTVVRERVGEQVVRVDNADGSATYFKDPAIADQYSKGEITREQVLNYTQAKEEIVSPEGSIVSEVEDAEGNVVHSEVHDIEKSTEVRRKLEENLQEGQTINIRSPEESIAGRIKRGAPANDAIQRGSTETQTPSVEGRESGALQGARVDDGRSDVRSVSTPQAAPTQSANSTSVDDTSAQQGGLTESTQASGDLGDRRLDGRGSGESVRGTIDDGQTGAGRRDNDVGRGGPVSGQDNRQSDPEYGAQTAVTDSAGHNPQERTFGRLKESELDSDVEREIFQGAVDVFEESGLSEDIAPVAPEGVEGDSFLLDVKSRRAAAYAARAENEIRYPALSFMVLQQNGQFQVRAKVPTYTREKAAQKAQELTEKYPGATFIIRPSGNKYSVLEMATPEQAQQQLDARELDVRIRRAQLKATTVKNVVRKDPSQEWQLKRLGKFTAPNGKKVDLYLPAVTSLGMNENSAVDSEVQAAQDGFTTGVGILYERGYIISPDMFDKFGRFNDSYEIYVPSRNVQDPGVTVEQAFGNASDGATLDEALDEGLSDVNTRSGERDIAAADFDPTEIEQAAGEGAGIETTDWMSEDTRYYDDIAQASLQPPATSAAAKAAHTRFRQDGVQAFGMAAPQRVVSYAQIAAKNLGIAPEIQVYSKKAARDLLPAYHYYNLEGRNAQVSIMEDGIPRIVIDTDRVPNIEQQLLVLGHEMGHIAYRKMLGSKAHQQMVQSLRERYLETNTQPLDKQSFGNLQFVQELEDAETGEVIEITDHAQRRFDRFRKNRRVLEKVLRCLNG